MTYIDQPSAGPDVSEFDVSDRGLLLGDGVFDTSLILNGCMVFEAPHKARLLEHAKKIGIDISAERLDLAIRNALYADENGILRLTVTRGCGGRGLLPAEPVLPTIIARLAPLAPERIFAPMTGALSSIKRNETSPTANLKSLSYLDNLLSLQEAQKRGADEAILLNTKEHIACGSVSNIFILKGDTLATPPIRDGAMPGVIRGWLIEHASQCGVVVDLQSITPDRLDTADAVLSTNSLRLISVLQNFGQGTSPYISRLRQELCDAITVDGHTLPAGARV